MHAYKPLVSRQTFTYVASRTYTFLNALSDKFCDRGHSFLSLLVCFVRTSTGRWLSRSYHFTLKSCIQIPHFRIGGKLIIRLRLYYVGLFDYLMWLLMVHQIYSSVFYLPLCNRFMRTTRKNQSLGYCHPTSKNTIKRSQQCEN